MTTVSDLVYRTRSHLEAPGQQRVTTMKSACVAADTTILLTATQSTIVAGTILEVDDELIMLMAWNQSTQEAQVVRGWWGTTAADHDANTVVFLAPRWTNVEIRRRLVEEIRSWPDSLFAETWVDTDIDVSDYSGSTQVLTTPPTDAVRPLAVQWVDSEGLVTPLRRVVVRPASETQYRVDLGEYVLASGTLRVAFATRFDLSTFEMATEVESTILMPSSMSDIPPLGAAMRLLPGREVQRTNRQAQGEPRIADESPANHILSPYQVLGQMRQVRIAEEAARLLYRWPLEW